MSAGFSAAEATYLENEGLFEEAADLTAFVGGGLDARAREGVSQTLVEAVIAAVVAIMLICASGSLRVAVTSGTVAQLSRNAKTSEYIQDLRAANDDLRITRSLLIQSDRISRIATQNLGMVYASDAGILTLE